MRVTQKAKDMKKVLTRDSRTKTSWIEAEPGPRKIGKFRTNSDPVREQTVRRFLALTLNRSILDLDIGVQQLHFGKGTSHCSADC